jgi:hypothetical protein
VGPTVTLYGPNSARVEALLARAASLTESEGAILLQANHRAISTGHGLGAALRDIVFAAHRTGRTNELSRADRAGRSSVTVFGGTARGAGVAGIVGRLAETLVVADAIPVESYRFMMRAWDEAIPKA